MSRWAEREGAPHPLGASWVEEQQCYNFALFSKHAESVTLLCFAEEEPGAPLLVRELDATREKSGRVWHCRVPRAALRGASLYAYRVAGPAPRGKYEWHWFDPEKLLLDPFARALWFPPGFDRAAAMSPGSNLGKAPLAVLPEAEPAALAMPAPGPRHEADAIIYELHVRGFTMHPSSGVSAATRGTFAGLVDKIPYLLDLGVNVVELMPVFQYDPQYQGMWGYMPVHFFACHAGYAASSDARAELRETVEAFHRAGIEVILDVVYNHTGEGDHRGPTYSFRGIDNSTYYLATGDSNAPYLDFSGTGNSMNCANRHVRTLVMSSLRYWAAEMGVDGFRFDVASVFTRGPDGEINWDDPPIIGDLASDPQLSALRLIAEPWDAAGAYQLGRDFPGITWGQWNARYRDQIRRFVRGDPGMVSAMMQRLYGSDDLFPDTREHAYRPHQSINYVTSHDGFTLYDLTAYSARRNWANGHDNTDGPAEEHSWNCGWEGDDGAPPEVLALRQQQAKNCACLLMLSNGTPMLRAGDEFLNTQAGNNNPYNQDNETWWLDWRRLEQHREVQRFFRLMIGFRKAHPSLCRSRFWRGDVAWYGLSGPVDTSHESRSFAFCVHGASEKDDDIYALVNASAEPQRCVVQEWAPGAWHLVIDTGAGSPDDFREPGSEVMLERPELSLAPRSVVVMVMVSPSSTTE